MSTSTPSRDTLTKLGLAGLLATLALGLTSGAVVTTSAGPVSGTADGSTGPTVSATVAPVRSCASLAASLTRSEQVGQVMMVAISSHGMSSSQAKVLARGHVGSVLLLGNSTAGARPVKKLSGRVHALGGRPRGVKIMLAVDQEGGQVQRLRGGGFDRMPTARSQARMSAKQLTSKAERWGRQLRAAGVDANLAPVADVVPKSMERVNRPIGLLQRGYGPDPAVVAAKVPAFVRGMEKAGVVTAVKHFPGLGRVRGNTDFERKVVDSTTTRHDRALKGFAAGSGAGVDMVMMSSAYYAKIDKSHRAVFSKVVMKDMLRGDLKFSGVVISDDLAARAVQDMSAGARALTFLRAGGDLIIVGDAGAAAKMMAAVKAKADSDAGFRADLRRKVTRVLEMKARRGLASCG